MFYLSQQYLFLQQLKFSKYKLIRKAMMPAPLSQIYLHKVQNTNCCITHK